MFEATMGEMVLDFQINSMNKFITEHGEEAFFTPMKE